MVDTVITFDPAPPSAGVFFDPSNPGAAQAGDASGRRHLLGLEGLTRERLTGWLDAADAWRSRWRESREPTGTLGGVEICNAFFEDSTRTRMSFELAARRLGATVLTFGVAGSSISKGETLLDTLRTLASMGLDTMVLRHRSSGVAAGAARELPVAIVNA